MDEELKKQIEAMLAPVLEAVKTLTGANQTIVERLEAQDTATTETAEALKGLQGNVETLQQGGGEGKGGDTDLDDPTAAMQARIAELEKQATEDRTAAEQARADAAAQNLRTQLGTLGETAGMRGTAKDSFVNEFASEFELADGGAIQVKGKQSPKDATKPYLAQERIEGLRETHPHFWPAPKAGDYDKDPTSLSNDMEQLDGLEGQELFDTISRPLAQAG